MTGGVAAGDFDGDGLVDLVFTRMGEIDILYRNLGSGTFEPRTTAAGFTKLTQTNGVVSGDIDNDGDLDLYMTGTDTTRNFLYLNDGTGVFADAGAAHTAALSNGVSRFGQGASFGDYDADGNLDLVTASWRDETSTSQSRLLRNLGSEHSWEFEDITEAAGLNVFRHESHSWRFTPRLVDLDHDGHLDLPIASDFMTSQLFWSNGDGTFSDGTTSATVGTDLNGMGSTFGDYDGDGDLDWFITNITSPPDRPDALGGFNRLYRNDGNRTFTDVTLEAGVRDSQWAWGTSFFDYDNDGDLDLIATNGWNFSGWANDQTKLWRNDGGVFTDVSTAAGIIDTLQGRGLAHLDYDDDGDLDVVVVNNGAAPVLYRNDSNEGAYLRIDVEGVLSNRDGIGAWITVTPNFEQPAQRQVWEVDGGSSFLSQNERTAHFGLGDRTDPVDLVTIEWPSGLVQHLFDVAIDQKLNVLETDQWALADFNSDGVVDDADYIVWRHGGSDPRDLLMWQTHFRRSAAVPEPGQFAMALVGVLMLGWTGFNWGRRRETNLD
jgi:hypothetical protein